MMMLLVPVIDESGCAAGHSSNGRAWAATSQGANHGSTGRADTDASSRPDMGPVPVRMIVVSMMINGCRRGHRNQDQRSE